MNLSCVRTGIAVLLCVSLMACLSDWDEYRVEFVPSADVGAESGVEDAGEGGDGSGTEDMGEETDTAEREDGALFPDTSEDTFEDMMEEVFEDTSEDTSGDTSEDVVEDVAEEDASEDVVEDVVEDTSEDVAEDSESPWDCSSFALESPTLYMRSLYSKTIEASGGSGEYQWRFAEGGDNSGAILDEVYGDYFAGPVTGVTDRIEVSDENCALTRVGEVHVVPDMVMLPVEVDLPQGTEFCFQIDGGSATVRDMDVVEWRLIQAGSGQDVMLDQRGCYQTGQVEGTDIIEVRDTLTGQVLTARVNITSSPITLDVGIERLMVPAGERFQVPITGGSRVFDFELQMEGAGDTEVSAWSDGVTGGAAVDAGMESGAGVLRVNDRFLPALSVEIALSVMGRSHHPEAKYMTYTDEHTLDVVGDVNGDGYDDMMLSGRMFSPNGSYSGAAYLYLGGAGGFEAAPVQVISGEYRNHYLGRSVAGGDFNKDGCQDVAIGAWGGVGEVQIWVGCQEGVPRGSQEVWNGRLADNMIADGAPAPLRRWKTLRGASRFGWTVASGDFDGDGQDDLAVTSPHIESPLRLNPANNNPYTNVGRVEVFTHPEDGDVGEDGLRLTFGDVPSVVLDGAMLQEDGAYVGANNMEFGWALGSADLNGDGCDELFVGSGRANGYYGFASLFMSEADGASPGGCALSTDPALELHPESPRAGRMGWVVKFGDFNGDCRPDLVIAEPTAAAPGGSNAAAGVIHVVYSSEDWAPGDRRRLVVSDLEQPGIGTWLFADNWDHFGWDVEVGDLTGDGIDDILTGSRYGEENCCNPETGTVGDVGEVRIYRGTVSTEGCAGRINDDPVLVEEARISNRNRRAQDLFGAHLAIGSDMTGDGVREWAAYAPRGPRDDVDDLEDHMSRVYTWSSASLSQNGGPTIEDAVALDTPAPTYLDLFGWSVMAVGDLNADGYEDFAASAPIWEYMIERENDTLPQGSAGGVFLYWGGEEGVRTTPDAVFAGWSGHSSSDWVGYHLTRSGDIDGDGYADMLVSAVFEDNSNAYCNTPCRAGGPSLGNNGMFLVFRGGPDRAWPARFAGDDQRQLPMIDDPDIVFCGPQIAESRLGYNVLSGFDMDGDMKTDVLTANWAWNGNRGQVWQFEGESRQDSATPTVYCLEDADLVDSGVNANNYLGYGLAATDISGDGCDDMLVSAYNGDPGSYVNSGLIHVLMGCDAQPAKVTLTSGRNNDNVGYRLIAADVNGDGVKDILASSTGYGSTNIGSVLVYDGLTLRRQVTSAAEGSVLELGSALFTNVDDPVGVANVNFGIGLATLGDINADGYEDFAVGAQLSAVSGVSRSGGAFVYLGSDERAELQEVDVVVGGEVKFPDGRFGHSVSGARVHDAGPAVLIVGAPYSEWIGPAYGDMGTVFIGAIPGLE